MAMRRKGKPESASGDWAMGQARLVAGHASLSTGLSAVNFRLDALQAELKAGFEKMDARFEKVMTALDRMTGEFLDNRQSHTLFGTMLGEHRRALESHDRRLTALESRLSPPVP